MAITKKPKKELNATQTKNKYRAIQYTCVGGQFVSILAPYVVIGAINFDEYFVYNTEGWKVGTGGTMALALMGFAVWAIGKKKDEKSEYTQGYLSLGLIWLAVAFLFFMLSSILGDLAMIMLCGSLGIFGALGLQVASTAAKKKADTYQEAIKEVSKDDAKEKAKKEAMEKARKEFPTE